MKKGRHHIVIVCSRLDLPGGTEKASIQLAQLFVNHGHQVSIIIADETSKVFYPVDERIHVNWAPLHFGIGVPGNFVSRKVALLSHIRILGGMVRKIGASVVIGTEYHLSIACRLAAINLHGVLVIAWENHHIHWLQKNRFWDFLFRKIYPKMDQVVCQNSREKKQFEQIGCSASVIPYSIDKPVQASNLQNKTILTIGWLIHRKGVDMIPSIAQKVFSKRKDWKWKIIGRGERYDMLQTEIIEKNLQPFITIQEPGSPEMEHEYLAASIYVMTSRFECLPLVLLEAGSYGIPMVAFDCPTGPSDIITDGANGFLVPLENTDAMAEKIRFLIENKERRSEMGQVAIRRSHDYSKENIYRKWEDLFKMLST